MIIIIIISGFTFSNFLSVVPNDNTNDPPDQDDFIYYYGVPIWQVDNTTSVFSAPENIVIENISYFLEGYIWRDFMPGGLDHSLRIASSMTANDSFPLTIDFDLLWVRKDSEIFNVTFSSGDRGEYYNKFTKTTYGGPEWEEGSKIDLAIRIINDNNNTYYLKAENLTLIYTW